MKTLSIQDLFLVDQKVLLRVDFNVPLQKNGIIVDDTRIKQATTSINYIISQKGKVIILSHLGRPKGTPDRKLSLLPCAKRLSKMIRKSVILAPDCIGTEVNQIVEKMNYEQVVMLENLRFHIEEENPPNRDFAAHLATLGDCYVNDAFASSHRLHSSITILPTLFPGKSASGFLMEEEITGLSPLIRSPKRPFHIILGGSKIGTKINILYSLLDKIDCIYLGGGMAFTFFKAQGYEVGNSYYDLASVPRACELIELFELCREKMVQIHLPQDIAASHTTHSKSQIFPFTKIKPGWTGLDIGPDTITNWASALSKASTIFWNGPLGMWEMPEFSHGTRNLAQAITTMPSTVVAGGGDLTAALRDFQITEKFSYISTGGGERHPLNSFNMATCLVSMPYLLFKQ
ncbi:MAG: phosphoglycerate kinase [Chlamydiales bacterium]